MSEILEDTDKVPAVREDATNPAVRTAPQPPVRQQYTPPPQQGGGCGCWLIGLGALLLALILIGIGLFLPPVNLYDRLFGVQYAMLDAVNNAALSPDGALMLVLDPADVGDEFGVVLANVSQQDFDNANAAAGEWIPAAKAAVPPYLVLQSSVYDFQTTGDNPDKITLTLNAPAGLDTYGYDISTGRWRFLPAQPNTAGTLTIQVADLPDRLALFHANPISTAIFVPVDVTQTLTDAVAQVATIVSPAGMQPAVDGSLIGSLAPGFNVNSGYRVMPIVRNYFDPRATDPGTIVAIIGNRTARSAHIQQLTAFAGSGGFQGVFIDYRDLPADQRDNFSLFIKDLKTAFRNSQLTLGVVVPAAVNESGSWNTGAYDWRALGEHADYLMIDLPLDPLVFTPGEDRLIHAMLTWAVGEVSRYKIVAGLDALSVREVNGVYSPISYDGALAGLGNVEIQAETYGDGKIVPGSTILASLDGFDAEPGLDTQLQMPFINYLNADGSKASSVWLMTGDALRARLDHLEGFGIGGVAFSDLTDEGVANTVLEAIANYKLQLPATNQAGELALRWRVESPDGSINNEIVTRLDEDLEVTLEAVEGNFAINVEVVQGELSSVRSGAAVAQFAPTATPTPLPTATPTLEPTLTPTLETIIPTQESAGGGGFTAPPNNNPAVNPGPGSIVVGTFEYGGHVTSTNSDIATNAMNQAGMRWMKVQIGYFPGKNPGDLAPVISDAHGRNFKVLLGIVGTPGDLAAGGAGYIQGYASFLGSVAALGPDAIEVWNEPNLSREWPEGAINGANYTSMLAQSYQAIKSTNGNVMVISAALAPTGAEAAYPGKVVNDDNFLRQMMDAGAMNYLDCVGIHYNEGIVSPGQSSGDPRDNYYTRYFYPMIDTYWGITGGQKPLCITELGYLSPEGYGTLPAGFEWGQGTTVAQQSAWLAQAIAQASQTGKVRLLIVWNVDFTAYGSDPQGGYAMVRPGGGCPACAAIAGAR